MQLRHFIFPVFIIVCLLVFWRTTDYGFATDYLGWLNRYRDGSWEDVWTCFDYPGLHQFFHFINYGVYVIFGANIKAIGILFIVAHASTSYLIYRTLRLFLNELDDDRGGIISIFTAMLFALSPYSIEVITWDACLHYILCTALCFGSLNLLFQFIQKGNRGFLIGHFVLWVLALFTIELALVAPGIFVLYISLYTLQKKGRTYLFKILSALIPAYLFLLGIYFFLTKYMIGEWIGHYGAEKHLQLDPTLLVSTFLKYLSKLSLLSHHWPFSYKEKWYAFLSEPLWALSVFTAVMLAWIWFILIKKIHLKKYILFVGFFSFMVALLPVLNLFFLWVVPYENDRYSYFASPHLYLFFSAVIVYFFKSRYFFPYVACIALNGVLLGKMTDIAKQAGTVTNGLTQNFNYYDEPEIVLLCVPENLQGAYLFRDYSDTIITFNETLDWLKQGQTYKGRAYNIAQFNLTSQHDSVSVQVIDSSSIRVNIASWGTWFWRKGVGLSSFENEEFKVTTGDLHFIFQDKYPGKNRLFLYTVGNEWRTVRLPQRGKK